MKAEISAVKALLVALGKTVHEITASGHLTYPYYILWSSSGNAVERSVRAETTDIDDHIGVTTVGATASSVRDAMAAARGALCPNGLPSSLTVTGRVAVLDFFEARPIQADTDVALTAGVHPLYAVDLYRLVSTPA